MINFRGGKLKWNEIYVEVVFLEIIIIHYYTVSFFAVSLPFADGN